MVVLSILVIALGMVVTNITGIDSSSFNAQIRGAVVALTHARRLAIVEGQPRAASFYALDPESADYDDLTEKAQVDTTEALWTSEALTLGFQEELNQDREDVAHVEITFFPQGGSTGGVLSFSLDERSAMVRVDPITGRIATAYGEDEFGEAH